jgi:hypothetical protein
MPRIFEQFVKIPFHVSRSRAHHQALKCRRLAIYRIRVIAYPRRSQHADHGTVRSLNRLRIVALMPEGPCDLDYNERRLRIALECLRFKSQSLFNIAKRLDQTSILKQSLTVVGIDVQCPPQTSLSGSTDQAENFACALPAGVSSGAR